MKLKEYLSHYITNISHGKLYKGIVIDTFCIINIILIIISIIWTIGYGFISGSIIEQYAQFTHIWSAKATVNLRGFDTFFPWWIITVPLMLGIGFINFISKRDPDARDIVHTFISVGSILGSTIGCYILVNLAASIKILLGIIIAIIIIKFMLFIDETNPRESKSSSTTDKETEKAKSKIKDRITYLENANKGM